MTDEERMATICHLEHKLELACIAYADAHGTYLWMAHAANQSQDPTFADGAEASMRAKLVHRHTFKSLIGGLTAAGEPDRAAAWLVRFEMGRDNVEQIFRKATEPPKPKGLEMWEVLAIAGAVYRGGDGAVEVTHIPRKWKQGVIKGAIKTRRSDRKRKKS